jgi:hypothetical protein
MRSGLDDIRSAVLMILPMPNGTVKMVVVSLKIPASLWEAARKQAKKEDRTAAYLVRVFLKQGLDDRNKGARE